MQENKTLSLVQTAVDRYEKGEDGKTRAALIVAMLLEYNLWLDHTSGIAFFREVVLWWRRKYPESAGLGQVQLILQTRRMHLFKQGAIGQAKALTDWYVPTDGDGKDGFERLDYLLKLRTAKVEVGEDVDEVEDYQAREVAKLVYLHSDEVPCALDSVDAAHLVELRGTWTSLGISGRYPTAYATYFKPDRPGVLLTSLAKDMDDYFGTNPITDAGLWAFMVAAVMQTMRLVQTAIEAGTYLEVESGDGESIDDRIDQLTVNLCSAYSAFRAGTPVAEVE